MSLPPLSKHHDPCVSFLIRGFNPRIHSSISSISFLPFSHPFFHHFAHPTASFSTNCRTDLIHSQQRQRQQQVRFIFDPPTESECLLITIPQVPFLLHMMNSRFHTKFQHCSFNFRSSHSTPPPFLSSVD